MQVAVLPGDGIGPEVIAQARKVFQALKLGLKMQEAPVGGAGFAAAGDPLPAATLKLATDADAILFGAVGDPRYDAQPRAKRPEQAILGLRRELGLFANLRPAQVHSELAAASALKPEVVAGLDILIVRELTGDIYFGQPRGIRAAQGGGREGFDTMRYSEAEIRRIARVAFEAARKRAKRVCSVDKANVLETSQLWREVVTEESKKYPDVELSHMYVDNCAMQLVRDPKQFDVIVTGNLFGDILSDEASMLTGSIGMLPSASLDARGKGLYEPVHGSAPDIAGRGVANPLATILSAAMMLRYSLGQPAAAERIERAVGKALRDGYRTADIHTPRTRMVGTAEMGDAVVARLWTGVGTRIMLRVGIVGWRGMVGSVLVQRMREERDFDHIEPVFFSTSQAGGRGPAIGRDSGPVGEATDLEALGALPVIVSCQGGDYTSEVYPKLRRSGWKGYWIDAARTLRMADDAVIILDPVNMPLIKDAVAKGTRNYIGGNCTVSLMLMGVAGLFRHDQIEWMTAMTYQAASGAGAANVRELVEQMARVGDSARLLLDDPTAAVLDIDRSVSDAIRSPALPRRHIGHPLAANLLPWIDEDLGNGQSREEWKGQAETNKILGRNGNPVPVDGICVRVGAMRCHSQALTIKLRHDVPLDEIEGMILEAHEWVKVVPNRREESLAELTPAAVTGKLSVPVGRLRKLPMGGEYLAAFTVGDQLLWGAAEPLRRMLRILLDVGVKQ